MLYLINQTNTNAYKIGYASTNNYKNLLIDCKCGQLIGLKKGSKIDFKAYLDKYKDSKVDKDLYQFSDYLLWKIKEDFEYDTFQVIKDFDIEILIKLYK